MRLFVAVEVNDKISEYLRKVQDKIRKITGKLNFVSSFHQTLKFLGEVSEEDFGFLREKLKTVKFEKFKVHLDSIGTFSSGTEIRSIWVGLKPENKLDKLHELVENALAGFGDSKFSAHLTLARVKQLKNKDELKDVLNYIKVENILFEVNCFKLIKSTLTPNGPVYEIVEEYGL